MAMNVSSGKGGRGGVAPAMNVTPLVDVVLVLLIIFMVVAPLLAKQLWLDLPRKDDAAKLEPPAATPDEPVVLTVSAAGAIRINRDEVSRRELEGKLRRVFAARKEAILYFDADDEAPYALTVDVMDIARRGGARSIAILTEKPGS